MDEEYDRVVPLFGAPGCCVEPPKFKCILPGQCELCYTSGARARKVPSMTSYAEEPRNKWHVLTDSYPPPANPDLFLCRDCEEEYVSYWEEMWREYYSGLL